jgi:hypothetical protein
MTSPDPQMIYLSNAGTDQSVVLNAVRGRAGSDPNLAYLEWSASPDRTADDVKGWVEANPALGHIPTVMRSLETSYQRHKLAGTMTTFETEHLCRWVVTMRERLVDEGEWMAGKREALEQARRPFMAVAMDPSGTRASAAEAWQDAEGYTNLKLLFDVPGAPIAVDALGTDMRQTALRLGVREVGFDPLTDAELAKFFRKATPLSGQKWANASATFARLVRERKLRWVDCEPVTDDLVWTARKPHDESGSFQAVRANDDRPITAALAAIRAVWLASGPKPPVAKVL